MDNIESHESFRSPALRWWSCTGMLGESFREQLLDYVHPGSYYASIRTAD
jgi:hypothetical protein